MKKRFFALIMAILLTVTSAAFAHSGRTDSKGGHKDNKNASGLGSYHYHCGGNPPHLHDGGVCPYGSATQTKATEKPTAKPTAKPTEKPASAPAATQKSSDVQSAPLASELSLSDDGQLSEPAKGKMNAKGVNARAEPKAKAKSLKMIERKGTEIEIIGIVSDDEGQEWYVIMIGNTQAYIPARYVDLVAE